MTSEILKLHGELKSGAVSSTELTKKYLQKIKDTNKELNSFITVCEEPALMQAKEADRRIKDATNVTPLTGVPISLKDIFLTRGIRTTCASKMLENYVAPYNGTAVARLIDAGAVIVGKTNMDEFAMGASNEYSYFGPVKNPLDTTRVPGGSSGGSAASVASGQCVASLGTDTGGSIRQPAAFCGVVGIKPTYGRVSRYGVVAFASSLDQVGPIATSVTDAAIMLRTIAGHDPHDATSLSCSIPDYTKNIEGGVKGLTIGIPRACFGEGLDGSVKSAVLAAVDELKRAGANVCDIEMPNARYAIPTYYIIAPAEASANLARYDGIRFGHRAKGVHDLRELYNVSRSEGFGPEVTLRIMTGTYVLSSGYYDAYYLKAQKVRTLIKNDYSEAFKKCDVIITPTSPSGAFKFGEKTSDPVAMYLADIYTSAVNLAGLPAMSVPCGKDTNNMPVGMQIIGRALDEETIFKVGRAYEKCVGR